MKTNTKILLGFISVIFLILLQIIATYKLQNDLYTNTLQIKDVEAPLDLMTEQVIGYDAMLTGDIHASLLYASNGDYKKVAEYKAKYDETGTKLDNLLKLDARDLIVRSQRSQAQKEEVYGYLTKLDTLNLKLVDLETGAFAAIGKKDIKTATSLVLGEDYRQYKAELFDEYSNWSKVEHTVTNQIRNKILETSRLIEYLSLVFSIILMIVVVVVMQAIRNLIMEKYKKYKQFGEYLEHILNSVADPIFVKDDTYRFITANDALCNMLGIARENIIGKTLGESLPENQMEHFLEVDKKVLESGQENVCEEPLTGKEGQILTIITKKTRYIDEKGDKFLVGVIRDITEHRQMEVELENNEKRYRSMIENSNDSIFLLDRDYKFISLNSSVATNIGKSIKELIGKSISEVFPKEVSDQLLKNIKIVFETGDRRSLNEEIVLQGHKTNISTSLYPIKDQGGKVTEVAGIVRDITDTLH